MKKLKALCPETVLSNKDQKVTEEFKSQILDKIDEIVDNAYMEGYDFFKIITTSCNTLIKQIQSKYILRDAKTINDVSDQILRYMTDSLVNSGYEVQVEDLSKIIYSNFSMSLSDMINVKNKKQLNRANEILNKIEEEENSSSIFLENIFQGNPQAYEEFTKEVQIDLVNCFILNRSNYDSSFVIESEIEENVAKYLKYQLKNCNLIDDNLPFNSLTDCAGSINTIAASDKFLLLQKAVNSLLQSPNNKIYNFNKILIKGEKVNVQVDGKNITLNKQILSSYLKFEHFNKLVNLFLKDFISVDKKDLNSYNFLGSYSYAQKANFDKHFDNNGEIEKNISTSIQLILNTMPFYYYQYADNRQYKSSTSEICKTFNGNKSTLNIRNWPHIVGNFKNLAYNSLLKSLKIGDIAYDNYTLNNPSFNTSLLNGKLSDYEFSKLQEFKEKDLTVADLIINLRQSPSLYGKLAMFVLFECTTDKKPIIETVVSDYTELSQYCTIYLNVFANVENSLAKMAENTATKKHIPYSKITNYYDHIVENFATLHHLPIGQYALDKDEGENSYELRFLTSSSLNFAAKRYKDTVDLSNADMLNVDSLYKYLLDLFPTLGNTKMGTLSDDVIKTYCTKDLDESKIRIPIRAKEIPGQPSRAQFIILGTNGDTVTFENPSSINSNPDQMSLDEFTEFLINNDDVAFKILRTHISEDIKTVVSQGDSEKLKQGYKDKIIPLVNYILYQKLASSQYFNRTSTLGSLNRNTNKQSLFNDKSRFVVNQFCRLLEDTKNFTKISQVKNAKGSALNEDVLSNLLGNLKQNYLHSKLQLSDEENPLAQFSVFAENLYEGLVMVSDVKLENGKSIDFSSLSTKEQMAYQFLTEYINSCNYDNLPDYSFSINKKFISKGEYKNLAAFLIGVFSDKTQFAKALINMDAKVKINNESKSLKDLTTEEIQQVYKNEIGDYYKKLILNSVKRNLNILSDQKYLEEEFKDYAQQIKDLGNLLFNYSDQNLIEAYSKFNELAKSVHFQNLCLEHNNKYPGDLIIFTDRINSGSNNSSLLYQFQMFNDKDNIIFNQHIALKEAEIFVDHLNENCTISLDPGKTKKRHPEYYLRNNYPFWKHQLNLDFAKASSDANGNLRIFGSKLKELVGNIAGIDDNQIYEFSLFQNGKANLSDIPNFASGNSVSDTFCWLPVDAYGNGYSFTKEQFLEMLEKSNAVKSNASYDMAIGRITFVQDGVIKLRNITNKTDFYNLQKELDDTKLKNVFGNPHILLDHSLKSKFNFELTLHPELSRYNALDTYISQEVMLSCVGSCISHPGKGNFSHEKYLQLWINRHKEELETLQINNSTLYEYLMSKDLNAFKYSELQACLDKLILDGLNITYNDAASLSDLKEDIKWAETIEKEGEMAFRFNAQHKRNVMYTAAKNQVHNDVINGNSEEIKIATIEDISASAFTFSGDGKADAATPFDGASYMEYTFAKSMNVSLGASKVGMRTVKGFGASYDSYLGIGRIDKTAYFVINNEVLRKYETYRKIHANMLNHKWHLYKSNTLFNIDDFIDINEKRILHQGIFTNLYEDTEDPVLDYWYFKYGDKYYKRSFESYKGDNVYVFNQIECNEFGQEIEGAKVQPVERKIDNSLALYDVLGGYNSCSIIDGQLQLDESSNENLFELTNNMSIPNNAVIDLQELRSLNRQDIKYRNQVQQPLKTSNISIVATEGAVKFGGTNINKNSVFSDPLNKDRSNFNYNYMKLNDFGPQLDKEHHVDEAEISNMTQVISAACSMGYTPIAAFGLYKALASISMKATEEFYKNGILLNFKNKEDRKLLQTNVMQIICNYITSSSSSNDSTLLLNCIKDLIISFKNKGLIVDEELSNALANNLPLDNTSIYKKVESLINSTLTKAGIKTKVPGTLSILNPAHTIIKFFNIPKNLPKYYNKEWVDLFNEMSQEMPATQVYNYLVDKQVDGTEENKQTLFQNFNPSEVLKVVERHKTDLSKVPTLNWSSTDKTFSTFAQNTEFLQILNKLESPISKVSDLKIGKYYILSKLTEKQLATQIDEKSIKDILKWEANDTFKDIFVVLPNETKELYNPDSHEMGMKTLKKIIKTLGVENCNIKINSELGEDLSSYDVYGKAYVGENEIEFRIDDLDSVQALFDSKKLKNPLDKIKYALKYDETHSGDNEFKLMFIKTLENQELLQVKSYNDLVKDYNVDQENLVKTPMASDLEAWRKGDLNVDTLIQKYPELTRELSRFSSLYLLKKQQDDFAAFSNHSDKTTVWIDGKAAEVDKNSVEIQDYGLIMSKVHASAFDLPEGIQPYEVLENPSFFIDKLISNFNTKLGYVDSKENPDKPLWKLELKRENGKHWYITSSGVDAESKELIIPKGLTLVDDVKYQENKKSGDVKVISNSGKEICRLSKGAKLAKDPISGNIVIIIPNTSQNSTDINQLQDLAKSYKYYLDSYKYNLFNINSQGYASGKCSVEIPEYKAILLAIENSTNKQTLKQWKAIQDELQGKVNLDLEDSINHNDYDESEETQPTETNLQFKTFNEAQIENYYHSMMQKILPDYLVYNRFRTSNIYGKSFETLSRQKRAAFLKSLEVVAARIPAQSRQSFMSMKVEGFGDLDENAAMVSIFQFYLQGSDLDIDAVSIQTYDIEDGGYYQAHSPYYNTVNIDMMHASDLLPLDVNYKGISISSKNTNSPKLSEILKDFAIIVKNDGTGICKYSSKYSKTKEFFKQNPTILNELLVKKQQYKDLNGTYKLDENYHELGLLEYDDAIKQQYEAWEDKLNSKSVVYQGSLNKPLIISVKETGSNTLAVEDITLNIDSPNSMTKFAELLYNTQIQLDENLKIEDLTLVYNDVLKQKLQSIFDKHYKYINKLNAQQVEAACKNYQLAQLYIIGRDPINLQQSMSSVDVIKGPIVDIAKSSEASFKQMFMGPGAYTHKNKAIKSNMSGKSGISQTATGLKTYLALTEANIEIMENHKDKLELLQLQPDGNQSVLFDGTILGKKYKYLANTYNEKFLNWLTNQIKDESLSPEEKEQFKTMLDELLLMTYTEDSTLSKSALLGLATDNAKELILEKINAGPETMDLYLAGAAIGVPFTDLYKIVNSTYGKSIVASMQSNGLENKTSITKAYVAIKQFDQDIFTTLKWNNPFDKQIINQVKDQLKGDSNIKKALSALQEDPNNEKLLNQLIEHLNNFVLVKYKESTQYYNPYKATYYLNKIKDFYTNKLQCCIEDKINVFGKTLSLRKEFNKLAYLAEEFRYGGKLFGLNQGIKNTLEENRQQLETFENIITHQLRLNNQIDEYDDNEYISDNGNGCKIDLYKFVSDEAYQDKVIEMYNNIKVGFNLLLPFKYDIKNAQYLKTLVASAETKNLMMLNTILKYCDKQIVKEFDIRDYKVVKQIHDNIANKFQDYVINSFFANKVKNKWYLFTNFNQTDFKELPGLLPGMCAFVNTMNKRIIPKLQTVLKNNEFIKNLTPDLRSKTFTGIPVINYGLAGDLHPQSSDKNEVNYVNNLQFSFNQLDADYNSVKDNVSGDLKVFNDLLHKYNINLRDAFVIYNLITNLDSKIGNSMANVMAQYSDPSMDQNTNIYQEFLKYQAALSQTLLYETSEENLNKFLETFSSDLAALAPFEQQRIEKGGEYDEVAFDDYYQEKVDRGTKGDLFKTVTPDGKLKVMTDSAEVTVDIPECAKIIGLNCNQKLLDDATVVYNRCDGKVILSRQPAFSLTQDYTYEINIKSNTGKGKLIVSGQLPAELAKNQASLAVFEEQFCKELLSKYTDNFDETYEISIADLLSNPC